MSWPSREWQPPSRDDRDLHEWERLDTSVFVDELSRKLKLLKKDGTLRKDPRYGGWSKGRQVAPTDQGVVLSGQNQDQTWAKQLASWGLTPREIQEHHFPRRSLTTIRRWCDLELRQYADLQAAVLAHPIVAKVKNLRSHNIRQVRAEVKELRDEYERTQRTFFSESRLCMLHNDPEEVRNELLGPLDARRRILRILLDECEPILDRVPVRTCEHCWNSFDAKRADSRFCSSRCQKAASRANVRDKSQVATLHPMSREGNMVSEAERLDQEALRRIELILNGLAQTLLVNRVPASVFGEAVDALVGEAKLEKAA